MSELEPDRELAKRDRKFATRILNSLVDHYLTPVGDHDPPSRGNALPCELCQGCVWEIRLGNFGLIQALCWLRQKGIHRE